MSHFSLLQKGSFLFGVKNNVYKKIELKKILFFSESNLFVPHLINKMKVPHKLILFGEHSVLFGKKCIACAIDLYGQDIHEETENIVILDINNKETKLNNIKLRNYGIKTILETRLGCGLGSSAVISIIISKKILEKYMSKNIESKNEMPASILYRNLGYKKTSINEESNFTTNERDDVTKNLELMNEILTKELVISDNEGIFKMNENIICNKKDSNFDLVLNLAFQIENIFHGKSSGCDVTTSYHKGLLLYQNHSYESIDPKNLIKYNIIIWDSCLSKCTKKIVNRNFLYNPKDIDEMGSLADRFFELLKKEFDLFEAYELIRLNHECLKRMDLVPDIMENEVLRLRKLGIECKITGAGNGGFLFTLIEKGCNIKGWKVVNIVTV